jgi:hypothetical protein
MKDPTLHKSANISSISGIIFRTLKVKSKRDTQKNLPKFTSKRTLK